MDLTYPREVAASPVFTKFPDLPVEIRCQIWSFAALSRPRVVQISYNPEKEAWRSCIDACGGLPSIIPVCREARQEALKPYTRLFETYIDLEEDIVFISDPVFTVRKARNIFMESDYANIIKRLAFTDDVYFGLKTVYEAFPKLVAPPAEILRKMRSLTHFTLVLMEDGAGFDVNESDFEEWDLDAEGSHTPIEDEDWDNEDSQEDEEAEEDIDVDETEEGASNPAPPATLNNMPGANELVAKLEGDWLSGQEDEAMERMSKGYYRHVGDIHFESAMNSPDHWDSWYPYLEQVETDFAEQHLEDNDWDRPMIAIAEVKYGLNWIGRAHAVDWQSSEPTESSSSDEDSDGP